MLYIDYENAKKGYSECLGKYNKLIEEKENILVENKPNDNIDERIREFFKIILARDKQVNDLEKKLLESTALEDQVYVCKFIKGMKATQISRKLFYSDAQIYRVIDKIEKAIGITSH